MSLALMTEEEVKYSYLHSFDRVKQIQILAELNNVPSSYIREVLIKNGVELKG